jgi:COX assembly mitochondrial protein 1
MSQPEEEKPGGQSNRAQVKDDGRDARLSFRKFAEHKMKREFKEEAIKKCEQPLKNFGQCAQESGLLVVFKCREFNRKINECMTEHNSPEKFEEFLKANQDELDKRTLRSKTA